MIPLSLHTLAQALDARLLGADVIVRAVSTDTRTLEAGTLFVALQGERFDGHDFCAEALKRGAGALLVSRSLPELDCPQLLVADTRLALGRLGALVRDTRNNFV